MGLAVVKPDPVAALEEAALTHYQQGQTSRLALADDLTAMHEHRSTREIAKWAEATGLDGISTSGRISQLTQWAEIVHEAERQEVLTAVSTPSERSLRPLFAKRLAGLTIEDRVDLLASAYQLAAAEDVALTSRHVAFAVNDAHPPRKETKQGRDIEAKALGTLDKLSEKPGATTRHFSAWRRHKKTPLSQFEAYSLCELIVSKCGSLDAFVEMVRKEQAHQHGLAPLLPVED